MKIVVSCFHNEKAKKIECAHCKQSIRYGCNYWRNLDGVPFCSDTCIEECYSKTQSLEIADTATKRLWDNEAKHDKGKLQLSLVPPSLERAVAEIRMYGQAKYGDAENWRSVERDRYFDALLRHVNDMRENGIDSLDGESKLKHLHHVATNVAFLIELSKGE